MRGKKGTGEESGREEVYSHVLKLPFQSSLLRGRAKGELDREPKATLED